MLLFKPVEKLGKYIAGNVVVDLDLSCRHGNMTTKTSHF